MYICTSALMPDWSFLLTTWLHPVSQIIVTLGQRKKLYFCVAVSVQSSGFCSSEIFSVVVIPAARSIRNLLDISVRITLCLHSSKCGLCEFLTIQITPSSPAGGVCAVFICVCAFICECVLWEASFVTGIFPSSLFRESWVTLFKTCWQISGFHFLSFIF